MYKTVIGNKAEFQACKFLISQNIQIIEQNFKALPYGEIDIISLENTHKQGDSLAEVGMTSSFVSSANPNIQNERILIFIEVKYRKSANFGSAQEMVSRSKQQKIINTANIFLERNLKYQNHECRFDVIAINNNNLEWIKNAFEV